MKVGVVEHDYLTLLYEGLATYDSLYFRYPTMEDCEALLQDKLYVSYGAYDGNNNLGLWARSEWDTRTWREWRSSEDAAAVRKLWRLAKVAATRDLEKLTEERLEGEPPRKLTPAVAADLESKAVARGMPRLSELERPGLACLARLMDNYRVGGAMRYVAWEEYTTQEEEDIAQRQNLKRKEIGFRVVPTAEGGLRTLGEADDTRKTHVRDMMALQDVLKVRAYAHEIADACPYRPLADLADAYLRRLKRRIPSEMRYPSFEEIRLVDRLLHEEVLQQVARGQGSLGEGIDGYLSEAGQSDNIWTMVDPQPASLPDQGVEAPLRKGDPAVPPPRPEIGVGLPQWPPVPAAPQPGRQEAAPPEPLCFVCGRPRSDHPKRRFCRNPSADGGKGKGKERSTSGGPQKAPRTDTGGPPAAMAGCAGRTPPDRKNPHGQKCCYLYHVDNKCPGGCNKSHACPRFVGHGVCMKLHRVVDCQER